MHLRAFREAFNHLVGQLEARGQFGYHDAVVQELDAELRSLYRYEEELFLPEYSLNRYFQYEMSDQKVYRTYELSDFVRRVLLRLDVAIGDPPATADTIDLAFAFVQDDKLRDLLLRDSAELRRVIPLKAYKSQIVLAGSCIEGVLFDRARVHASTAPAGSSGSVSAQDMLSWTLGRLMRFCDNERLLPAGVEQLAEGLKDYRNLVHPAVELRDELIPGEHEAHIAVRILLMLHRDLAAADHSSA